MSNIPEELLYTKEHEWLQKTEATNVVRVGITDFAQSSLGDVTFVELPEVGQSLEQGSNFGNIESVKAVSDLYAPISGEVTKINSEINDNPEWVNEDPYKKAWLIELTLKDSKELENLLNAQAYKQLAQ